MELQIRFTDQSESFTYGVEFGRLLEKMQRGDQSIDNYSFPIRMENKEVIESACKAYGYISHFGIETEGWINFIGIKRSASHN